MIDLEGREHLEQHRDALQSIAEESAGMPNRKAWAFIQDQVRGGIGLNRKPASVDATYSVWGERKRLRKCEKSDRACEIKS